MSYMAFVPGWWYVIDEEKRFFFTILVLGLDVFTMPLMFFLAGYFAMPSLLKRTRWEFFRGKLTRIGIPWMLGSVLVAPLLAYRSWVSLKLPTRGFLDFVKTDFWGPIYQQGAYWFLGVLLLFFTLLVLPSFFFETRDVCERPKDPVKPGPVVFLVFWFATGIAFFLANTHWPLDIWIHPGYLFVFQPLRIVPYFLTFCFGILAWKERWFLEGFFSPDPFLWLPLAVVTGSVFLGLKVVTEVQSTLLLKLFNALLHNGFSLAAMMGLLGVSSRFRSPCDPVGEFLGRKVYGVYWVHMPTIMILAWFLLPFQLSPYLKFCIVAGPGTVLCVLLAGILRKVPWVGRYF